MAEPPGTVPRSVPSLYVHSPSGDEARSSAPGGIDPFPPEFTDAVNVASVHAAHDLLGTGRRRRTYRVAGRIAARRGHGKAAFIDLVDASGRIQLYSRADVLGDDATSCSLGLDLGDIVGVDGMVFKTRSGELSLRVGARKLLAKWLRPPPDKYHGLDDTETRYRQRERT